MLFRRRSSCLALAAALFLSAGCSNPNPDTAGAKPDGSVGSSSGASSGGAGSGSGGSPGSSGGTSSGGWVGSSSGGSPDGSTETAPDGAALPSTADSRFRPQQDGFLFPNYADAPGTGIFGSAELRRMFGDKVCSSIANGVCTLTPQGQEWADNVDSALQTGHCEGFAVLSLLFYNKWLDPASFGASATSQLTLANNGALNHELAYWYATQYLEDPVIDSTHSFFAVDAVDYLLAAFTTASPDTIARIGIARIGADGSIQGGHAITPYAIADGPTPGTKLIMVYDNNWPGEERSIAVDLNANSWSYTAGVNPSDPGSLYVGDKANNNRLYVASVHPRLGQHACPFCSTSAAQRKLAPQGASDASADGSADASADAGPAGAANRTLLVQGDVDPLVQDSSGRRVGVVSGVIVNEIPGAIVMPAFGGGLWGLNAPVQLVLPPTGDLKVSVTPRARVAGAIDAGATDAASSADGSSDAGAGSAVAAVAAGARVRLFGGGYSLGVDYPAGATVGGDTIGLPGDASGVTINSSGSSGATLAMAVQTALGGITAHIGLASLPAGASVGLQAAAGSGAVGVSVASPTPVAVHLDVAVDKGDGAGKQVFEGAVQSSGADSLGLNVNAWTGGTDPLPITIASADGGAPTEVIVGNTHDYTPVPVNECALGTDDCSIDATCTDKPVGFACTCNTGFTGDGVTCVPGTAPPPPTLAAPQISYTFPGAPSVVYTVGKRASLEPPANAGGTIDSYGVAPALPAGLALDTGTGAISGTPTVAAASAIYTVSATNLTGTSQATLNLTVNGPAPQISYGTAPYTLTRWYSAAAIAPTSTGGPVAAYAIAPALPAGLALDPQLGIISGTPTVLSPAANYTVTATNASGSWPCTVALGVTCVAGAATCDNPPPATYASAVLADAPAAYYRLGDGTAVAVDSSPNHLDGSYLNTGSLPSGAPAGPPLVAGAIANDPDQATQFGSPLQVQTGYTQNAVTAYSVEAWFQAPAGGGGGVIYQDRGAGPGQSLTVRVDSGTVQFIADSDNIIGGATPAASVLDGNWHYLVGTWAGASGQTVSSSQFVLYLDGAALPVNPSTSGFGFTSPLSGLGDAFIGYHQAWGNYFAGAIDEVAVYEHVLSPERVQAHYLVGTGQPLPALPAVAYTFPGAPAVLYTVGQAVTLPAPTSTGGAILDYGVTPALPAGLALDPATGILSGTPTTAAARASYVVVASNAAGSASATLNVTVQP